MKYIDRDGDTWESVPDTDLLKCVERACGLPAGGTMLKAECEGEYGPLRPVQDGDTDNVGRQTNEPSGPTVSDVMSRASVYQAAHSLISGLEWPGDGGPNVYDVLQVAKWMEGQS
ncbi:hypothetical protein ACIGW0_31450 [Streptomyces bikiniensis]|uniref:Uncharacterized protein n=1 Tax=Streptomyces bikiniensis TaxID=1896 RepID=A0ABW8D1Z6_STRBI